MSANNYQDHIMILPEDDANRQLAIGFLLEINPTKQRQVRVLEEAGGWIRVFEAFELEYLKEMDKFPKRVMVLLIDFDGDHNRRGDAKNKYIPERLYDRVFVLGSPLEVEDLKRDLKLKPETIGAIIAKDCREGTNQLFERHQDLRNNNQNELNQLSEKARTILF